MKTMFAQWFQRIKTPLLNASLYQWMLTSFLVVSLPLVFAIFYAILAMNTYSKQAHESVFQTVVVTENSRLILERLLSMERSIRQYQVLQEAVFLEAYLKHHQQLTQLFEASELPNLNPALATQLAKLKRLETALFDQVYQQMFVEKGGLSIAVLQDFEALSLEARSLIQAGSKQQTEDLNALADYEETVRQKMFYILLVSGFLVLALSVFFVHFITHPIKRIRKAMRRLIKQDFETPIENGGPKDVQELGENLDALRRELRHLENEKQQFVRSISHELKTPLATLKEGTDLLSDELLGHLNAQQKEVIHLMKMGNFNIMKLVENLLEYQKAVSLQSRLDKRRFNVENLIQTLEQDYRLLLQSKQLKFTWQVAQTELNADEAKLKMILTNLLSNAIKMSPKGATIALTVKAEDDHWILWVEDQGPGVAASIRDEIFKDFFQGQTPQDTSLKGTGLGLAIVGYYVAQHQGQIELLEPTEAFPGARFALTLPMDTHT